ncbi:MAG: MFS transporter [Pseudonocardiaceae bacterium]
MGTPVNTGLGGRARAALRPFLAGGVVRRMYLATFVDAVGLGVYLAMAALYLTQSIGLGNTAVGLTLSLAGIASLAGLVPIGAMGDRWGSRRVLVALFLYRSLAFAGLLLADSLVTALAAVVAAGVVSRVTGPLTQALVLDVVDAHVSGVEALAVARSLRNAGFALGAAPAAFAVALGTRDAYRVVLLMSVIAFALAAIVVSRVPNKPGGRKKKHRAWGVVRDRRFMMLTIANGMLTLHALVLAIGFPLWLVQHTQAPRWLAALLLTVNTIMSVLFQVRFSRGSEQLITSRRMLVASGVLLALVCMSVPLVQNLSAPLAGGCFLILVGMLTVGELWQSAGSWGYTVRLAPDHQRGSYLAFLSLGFTVVTIVGPSLITAMVNLDRLGWLVLAGWFLVASLIVCTLPTTLARGSDFFSDRAP